ncbi:MAG TPA: DUF1801 domain-containing protein [Candidatus Limnocylindria bacterium]|nr:DUF1801 domain-containing protein [Candidatus Limnocylindria bacterium]
MSDTKKATKRTTSRDTTAAVWTDEERAAMQEHAREMKSSARRGKSADKAAQGEADVLAKIAEMPPSDRAMAERIHAIVKDTAPDLVPRTWYGMPAYASQDGKVICFFTPAAKFKERYATLGFNAEAKLDDGTMWPTSWALTKLTAADEAKITALVKKAVG